MRVALLGASHWHAACHAEGVRAAGAELVAVWDADPAAGQRAADGRPPLVDLAAFAETMRLTDDAYRMGGL